MSNIINIILLCILIYILFRYTDKYLNKKAYLNNIEKFQNNIFFLNKNQLLTTLILDKDNYYKRFYKSDLKARNVKNIEEYFTNIKYSLTEPTNEIKEKVTDCVNKADIFFKNIKYDYFNGIDNNKLLWKIGFIKNNLYEGGLPHTRGDVIILNIDKVKYSNKSNLIKTLIHEKIHIYQKKYPEKMQKYLRIYQFKKIKKRDEFDNIRANPDLDDYIYQDKNSNTYKAIYNNNISSVEDIIYYPENNQLFEHPFEKMAIDIENKYK